jgi:hypothetical protein
MARTHSKLQTQYNSSKDLDAHINAAVKIYNNPPENVLLETTYQRPSITEVAAMCSIPKETLHRCLAKRPSRRQVAAARSHLNETESDTLITFLLHCGDRGFPATRRDITCYALELARVRNPNLEKLGKSWVTRFLAKNNDKLQMQWSTNLDHSRAAGVNPTAIHHWFDLLEAQLKKFNFADKDIYGFDESRFPFGGDGVRLRIVARREATIQHVQRGGNRENITVMVTICADGTALKPTVLFKGKQMMSNWASWNVHKMK